ncbi:hypothetical protein EPI10_020465 [Gossypium australe]|uniref:Uncharacterized protein n=1 Tax=Gossypium australe TaxID=47621 RepID=A0A5B6WEC5_9ROSI|nr:hypothetical protein EPI10_020465 [Gossypium australe]
MRSLISLILHVRGDNPRCRYKSQLTWKQWTSDAKASRDVKVQNKRHKAGIRPGGSHYTLRNSGCEDSRESWERFGSVSHKINLEESSWRVRLRRRDTTTTS